MRTGTTGTSRRAPIIPMPGPEPVDLARLRPPPLGEDQHRKAGVEHLADVLQRLPRAGLALGQRERVEEQRRQVVVERVGEPGAPRVLRRKEVRLEEFLGHRRGDAVAEPGGQRRQDDRRIHVALVVRGENHRPADRLQVLAAVDANPREQPRDGQDPGRQARAADGACRPRSVPRRKLDRLEAAAPALSALLDDRRAGRTDRALRRTRARRCACRTRPRAPPSARPVRASSGQARRAWSSDVEIGAARVLRDERRQQIGAARPSAAPARRSSSTAAIAARFNLPVPSVRGSAASGQATARRIF